MKTPTNFNLDDAELDDDGVARYQLFRDSSGKSWREPIPEQVRREMRTLVFVDELQAARNEAFKTMAEEGIRLIQHGGSRDPDTLREHWMLAAQKFQSEMDRIDAPSQKLITAIKQLFNI